MIFLWTKPLEAEWRSVSGAERWRSKKWSESVAWTKRVATGADSEWSGVGVEREPLTQAAKTSIRQKSRTRSTRHPPNTNIHIRMQRKYLRLGA